MVQVLGPILQNTDSEDKKALVMAVKETMKRTDKKTLKGAVTEATKLKQRELSVSYRLTGEKRTYNQILPYKYVQGVL